MNANIDAEECIVMVVAVMVIKVLVVPVVLLPTSSASDASFTLLYLIATACRAGSIPAHNHDRNQ